jgi:hypothetical protein
VGFTPASGLGERPLFNGAWGELDIFLSGAMVKNGEQGEQVALEKKGTSEEQCH